MAMSVEHRSKFAALHRQWERLLMSEKFLSGTKTPKETNTDDWWFVVVQPTMPQQQRQQCCVSITMPTPSVPTVPI